MQAITDLSDLLEETTKSDPFVEKVFARLQVNDLPEPDHDTENSLALPLPSFQPISQPGVVFYAVEEVISIDFIYS